MTRVLGPDLVPEGFTDDDGRVRGVHAADRTPPDGLAGAVDEALVRLETRRAGGSATPMIRCSCRSAAAPATRCRG